MTDFDKTRWAEYYTEGKSAGGNKAIDKARMPSELLEQYNAREYLSQALHILDSRNCTQADLLFVENLAMAARYCLDGIDLKEDDLEEIPVFSA